MRSFEEKYTWEFEVTNLFDGLNNPMIEHFSGGYYHLAREIIQNSIDARDDKTQPVRVEFKKVSIPTKFFPGIKRFEQVLESCKSSWLENPEVEDFIDKALKCTSGPEISFLKVSDYNTIGLSGMDDDMNGGWFSLIKSRGASSKRAGEGGSFGIGKGAAFKSSPLRTVFYSTFNSEGYRKFQGIAELVTFKEEKKAHRGTGSFGSSNYGSIGIPEDIPEFFQRKEKGLDIFIAGSSLTDGQANELVESILRNFWYAIYLNELVVVVDDLCISAESLENLLIRNFENKPMKDHVEPLGNPLTYYEAIVKGQRVEMELGSLGSVAFYFYKTSEYLNHVAMIRKSHMVIYSKLYRHPENFAGVFICDNPVGNNALRRMEPPAHDKWDPERNKDTGQNIINEIGDFIRQTLRQFREIKPSDYQEIPELAKYLPFNDETSSEANGSQELLDNESEEESSSLIQRKSVFESSPVINPYEVSTLNKMSTGRGGGGTVIRKRKGRLKSKKPRNGGGGNNNLPARDPIKTEARTFVLNQSEMSVVEYALVLKSGQDVKCSVRVEAVGEEGNEPVVIKSVRDENGKDLRYNNSTISLLNLSAGQKKKLYVKLETEMKLSLKLNVNALQ